jgi:hypothetical protein
MTRLSEKTRQEMRENWLAPRGSELETQMIDSLLRHDGLTQGERNMLERYRKKRDSSEMHNFGFWETAKKLRLGGTDTYGLAMERHKKLEDRAGKKGNTWFVAWFIANSEHPTNKEIAAKLGITVDGVFRYGTRTAPEPDCMQVVAASLTESDVTAVAAWLASVPVPPDPSPVPKGTLQMPLGCGSEPN